MAKRGDKDDPDEGDDKKRLPEPAEGDEDTSASSTEEEADEDEDEDEEDASESDADEDESDEDEDETKDEDESDEDETKDEDESDEDETKDEDESDEDGSDEDEDEDESKDEDESEEDDDEPKAAAGDSESADGDSEEEEQVQLPAHLGAQKYVYSAFFAGSILFAYILGRTLETIWSQLASWDTAVDALPAIAVVADDDKQTYSLIFAGLVAVVVALRTFRKSSVRTWAEEVAAELVKVKWPTRKEVYGSTVVVLATSAIAVTYLFLLDRFWGFVTNLIYGSGT